MKKLKLNFKKLQIGITAAIFLVIIVFIIMIARSKTPKEEIVESYSYSNVAEQVLADEVIVYLQYVAGLGDAISIEMGNEAVAIYRSIIRSNVDTVNDDHTKAIQERIETVLEKYASKYDEDLSVENITALSAGITEIIWKSILSQIESVTEDVEMSEYFYLIESLEQQIKELENSKMKVSINANIKNNKELTADELLSTVNGMTDEEMRELAESFGISMEDLQKLLNTYNNNLNKELENKITELERELLTKVTSEIQKNNGKAEDGKNGVNGKNGKDGSDGKDGNDGKDGSNGKTTYIAYADDINGTGFSLTPTETSKYVGTCITDDAAAPKDYAAYSNWQIYRTYIITTTVDEYNVTTVHIN